jgi:hypothetical protein
MVSLREHANQSGAQVVNNLLPCATCYLSIHHKGLKILSVNMAYSFDDTISNCLALHEIGQLTHGDTMSVISLFELSRQELRHLLETRFMRTGWNREGDRKVSLKFHVFSALLDAQLLPLKDQLVVRPANSEMKALLTRAADERTFPAIVERFVKELYALPIPDQADAYAVSELRDKSYYLEGVRSTLEEARTRIAAKVGKTGVRGVDFDEIFDQLDSAIRQTVAEYDHVQETVRAYEREL